MGVDGAYEAAWYGDNGVAGTLNGLEHGEMTASLPWGKKGFEMVLWSSNLGGKTRDSQRPAAP